MQGVTLYSEATTGAGVQLRVVDLRRAAKTSTPAGADGLLTVEFDGPDAGRMWLIERMTVTTTSSTNTTCNVYAGPVAPVNLVDSTLQGNGDVADETSPVLIPSSVPLTVQWVGASVGAVGTIAVQFRLVELA